MNTAFENYPNNSPVSQWTTPRRLSLSKRYSTDKAERGEETRFGGGALQLSMDRRERRSKKSLSHSETSVSRAKFTLITSEDGSCGNGQEGQADRKGLRRAASTGGGGYPTRPEVDFVPLPWSSFTSEGMQCAQSSFPCSCMVWEITVLSRKFDSGMWEQGTSDLLYDRHLHVPPQFEEALVISSPIDGLARVYCTPATYWQRKGNPDSLAF